MPLDYLAHLAQDSQRFRSLLADIDPTLSVPSCPEWTASDLLWHLAEVQWFWGTIVRDRVLDPDPLVEPERPTAYADVLAFFDEQTDALQRALADIDPSVEVWMWADDHTVGYIRRRMAHEALIHRLDAELTLGVAGELDPDLASDGVHEALTMFFGGVPPWGTFTASGKHLTVEVTDTGLAVPLALGRWQGTSPTSGTAYDEGAVVPVSGRLAPDATLRGSAADLDRWVWNRGDLERLEVTGDQEAFDVLAAIVTDGVQ